MESRRFDLDKGEAEIVLDALDKYIEGLESLDEILGFENLFNEEFISDIIDRSKDVRDCFRLELECWVDAGEPETSKTV